MAVEPKTRHRFFKFRLSAFALTCVAIYVSAAAVSVIFAHAALVAFPQSGWAERIIAPVARGIEFLDAHWKAVLILIAPFAAPAARELIPRLRKLGPVELDPVPLEPIAVREKPSQKLQERRNE